MKKGYLFLLVEELAMQDRAYLTTLLDNGAVVIPAIATACAEGIVKSRDSNLLASNGGHITLTKYLAQHLLSHIGYVKRRAITKAKVTVQNVEDVKAQFVLTSM